MWFWKKKQDGADPRKEDAADREMGTGFDLVESLKQAAAEGGLEPDELFLSILFTPEKEGPAEERSNILLGNGVQLAEWRVESLRSLFRGDRQPPPDGEMEHYPEAYVPFFYRVEYNVYRYCRTMELRPTDGEFLEIYSQMRRRPDGKSMGPLHNVIWRSAALILGLRPWSEAEYTAVFGQLARSARHFRMGPSSRNYIEYLRTTVGREE
jgi:hypothetical protein